MKKWLYPLSCLALVTVMSACGINRTATPAPGTTTHGTQTQSLYSTYPSTTGMSGTGTDRTGTTYGTGTSAYGTAYGPHTAGTTSLAGPAASSFDQRLAEKVVRAAVAVPGVERAAAIVRGNDIIVGVHTRMNTASRTQRQVVERQVYSAVRSVAPKHNIHVTSEPALLSRIDRLDSIVRGGTTTGTTRSTYASGTAAAGTSTYGTGGIMSGPTTVTANLANAARDFAALLRDLGRTATAPFR